MFEQNDDGTLYAFEPTSIEDAIGAFMKYFNFESEGGSSLCQPCIDMLEQVRSKRTSEKKMILFWEPFG